MAHQQRYPRRRTPDRMRRFFREFRAGEVFDFGRGVSVESDDIEFVYEVRDGKPIYDTTLINISGKQTWSWSTR